MSSLSAPNAPDPQSRRPDLRLTVPARAEHVARARHAVEALAERAGALMASLTSALELRAAAGGGTDVWMAFDLGDTTDVAQRLRQVA